MMPRNMSVSANPSMKMNLWASCTVVIPFLLQLRSTCVANSTFSKHCCLAAHTSAGSSKSNGGWLISSAVLANDLGWGQSLPNCLVCQGLIQ